MSLKRKTAIPVLFFAILSLSASGLQIVEGNDGDLELKGDLPERGNDFQYTPANESDDVHLYTGPPVNGTFVLKLDINPYNSSKDEVNIMSMKRIQEREYRAGPPSGNSHFIRVLDRNGNQIFNDSFGLYSRSVTERKYPNGSWAPPKYEKNLYEQFNFAFDANYSARKVVVMEGDETIFTFRIPEIFCNGSKELHYCEWNNISDTDSSGGLDEDYDSSADQNLNNTSKTDIKGSSVSIEESVDLWNILNLDWLDRFL